MSHSRPFAQVDVFSSIPYRGNPVAVVLDGQGLSDADMHAVARWTNLSETTFLLPPTHPDADYLLRIFTPGGELPFAGHPTLGSAHAWISHGGHPHDPQCLIQECGAGLVAVRHTKGTFAFAAPPTVRDGALEPSYLDDIARAFGIDRAQILAHQWVDNGPGWAVVQLATAQEVLDLEPDLTKIPAAMIGVFGAHPAGSDYDFEMRTFAPGVGVTEDPVCGSINASAGQWLFRTGQVNTSYRVSQGAKLGRSGDITVSADEDGTVWIAGATTTLFHGTATI